MADHTTNPYVGPRTFEEEDAQFFFGREREARDLLSLVISEPLVLFYAQSGAGKSSLINTRLIPGLREEGFVILPVGRVGGELPSGVEDVDNVFAFNLLLSLSRGQGVAADELTHTTITDYLQARKESDLAGHLHHDEHDDDDWDDHEAARVLIIDQFEEIITTHLARWTEREAFFDQLQQAVRDDPLLWIVLALREDYVAALDPFARVLPGRLRARFHMERMGASAGRQAIEKPAQQNGRPFAPGVAKALVDNLRQLRTQDDNDVLLGQYIEPVQLQVVCYQLWQNLADRPPAPITQEDVNELGNVDAALSQFYEQAIAKVLKQTGTSELLLRNWFDRQLITESETRGTVYQGKEETAGLDNRVVQLLANQFLLRAEIRAGGTWYELVHDRFVAPILGANQAWRLQQNPLIRAAEEWDRAGRPRNKLYQGEALKDALEGVNRDSLELIVQRFLTASEDAQSQRDLAKTREEMQEQRLRAEAQARTAQRLRLLTIALVAIFLLAATAAFVAFDQAGKAQQNAQDAVAAREEAVANEQMAKENANAQATSAAEAQEARQEAETNEQLAQTNAIEAEEARQQAETNEDLAQASAAEAQEARQQAETNEELARASAAEAQKLSRLSLAQSLSAVAPRIVDRSSNTELAALLGVEAYHVNEEVDTEIAESIDDAMREILTRPYFNIVLEEHKSPVTLVAYSPDNNLLATTDTSGVLILWDLTQPQVPGIVLPTHEAAISALVFSRDGRWLATGDNNGVILLWDRETLTPIRLEGHQMRVSQLAFADTELISAGDDKIVYRWPLPGDTAVTTITPTRIPGVNINHEFLLLSPDGSTLITSNASRIVSLWDLTLPGLAQVRLFFGGNESEITAAALSGDMETLISANADGVIRIWDLSRSSPTPARIETESSISDMALSDDGRTLATIAGELSDLSVRVWDLSSVKDQQRTTVREGISTRLIGHTANIRAVAINPNGQSMASVGDDLTARVWNLGTAAAAPVVLSSANRAINTVAATPDQSLLLLGLADGQIEVWDMATLGQANALPVDTFQAHQGSVNDMVVTPDGQTLASGGNDGAIYLWTIQPMAAVPDFRLNGQQGVVRALAISPDGRWLASGGTDAIIRLWDITDILAGGTLTYTALIGHNNEVNSLDFSPDGQTLASSGAETAVLLWDLSQLSDGANLVPTRLSGHQDAVTSVDFSPDGRFLASGSEDHTVLLWNLERLQEQPFPLVGHDEVVSAVAFSPDSLTLASASWDRTIDLWDINAITGENPSAAPTILSGHAGQVTDLIYTATGQYFISAGRDNTVRRWVASVDAFVELACQQVHRNLSWTEWQRYLGGDEYRLTCPDLPVHPSFVESARELARMQMINEAVARFEEAIALGAELDFDPQEEAQREAVQGVINMGLRLAEQGNLPQAVEAFTQARDLDSSAITDLQWQRLCYFGQVWNETGIVQNACSTAVTAARSSDNVDFTQSVCVLGSTPDLASLVRPACQRLAELAAGTLDAYLALQICQLQNTVTGLEGIVAPICELSSSLTKSIASGGTDTGFIQSGQGEIWVFQGREGQVINIGLTADSGSLDPYLILLDPTGVVIAENNDVTEGVVRDARIEAVTLPTTGSYTIIARGNDDASVGSYTIALR